MVFEIYECDLVNIYEFGKSYNSGVVKQKLSQIYRNPKKVEVEYMN